ncbi:MAG TPA: methyltransferase domain-containing protein [Patescibacteria group bacterium]|nr:methyltransferase domain-containing protein [Patescibacteria group bacterium]
MNIKPTDIVLEIGSGNNPNPRSDILCDRYLSDDGERAGEFSIVIDRSMVVADGYHLPFDDKAFDYVICSHILEHMDDPKRFIAEVVRVAKSGYIEVPSALSERVFGWNFHHWYCSVESGVLMLRRKTEGEQFKGFFHRLIAQTIWFRRFFEKYEHEMYVRYEWNGSVNLCVDTHEASKTWVENLDRSAWKLLQQAKPDFIPDATFYIYWMMRRVKRKCIKTLRLLLWNVQINVAPSRIIARLLTILRCPLCFANPLIYVNGTNVKCSNCGNHFPVTNKTIPVLLSKKQITQGY